MRTDDGGRRPLSERRPAPTVTGHGSPGPALVRSPGAVVTDVAGRDCLDLLGDPTANLLGPAHPAVVRAVSAQAASPGQHHGSPAALLGELLLALTGPGRALLTGSGAEANAAALRVARSTGRTRVVVAGEDGHGRAPGGSAPGGRPVAHPSRRMPDRVTHVPFGDVEALHAAVGGDTATVIVEPIQSENGVVVPPPGYLTAVRGICTAAGALLTVDEARTGLGRTGHWFHYQGEGIEPDLVTLAPGLGAGLPLGACLAFGPAAGPLAAHAHRMSSGADAASCAAGLAVIRTIAGKGLLDHVKRVGDRLRDGIESLTHPLIAGVHGAGLLLGVVLTEPVAVPVAGRLRAAGFVVGAVRPGVLRLAPPLILTLDQAGAFVTALARALSTVSPMPPPARLVLSEVA